MDRNLGFEARFQLVWTRRFVFIAQNTMQTLMQEISQLLRTVLTSRFIEVDVSRHPVNTYQCERSSAAAAGGPKAKSKTWSASFVGKRHVVRIRTQSGDWHLWPRATLNNALIGTEKLFGRGVDISRYIPTGIRCRLVEGRLDARERGLG